jgi:hypothetical protein
VTVCRYALEWCASVEVFRCGMKEGLLAASEFRAALKNKMKLARAPDSSQSACPREGDVSFRVVVP